MSKPGFHFYALLSRMKYISRWGLMRNTRSENIQEHSLQVAIIAHALALIKNRYFSGSLNADRIAVLAMFHDCNEIITGDMPTPIKYFNPDIIKAYKGVEATAKNSLLSMLPDELKENYSEIMLEDNSTDEAWKLVKAADRIDAYIKCIEEEKAGNNEFKKAKESIYKSIIEIGTPEVLFFIENFLPSFSLTLDELE